MKVTIEFEDPNDFRRLSNWLGVLIKSIMNFGFELQADFIDDRNLIEDTMRQINKKVLND